MIWVQTGVSQVGFYLLIKINYSSTKGLSNLKILEEWNKAILAEKDALDLGFS